MMARLAIAKARNIPFHVDACLGGFILPWLKQLGHYKGEFDFSVRALLSQPESLPGSCADAFR
jgi:glutamate/tyrosine decarboxylase-like PLP-dependent enzyme